VIATPTVHGGPHPNVSYAALLANALRPKAKFAALIGSYGWSEKATIEKLSSSIPNLKVEVLGSVFCKGLPREEDYQLLTELADAIAKKHAELDLK
jgi:flavorubredoxin